MPASPSTPSNLVFLHGFLGSTQDWEAWTAYQSETFITLPGHQWSPLPTQAPLLPQILETLQTNMPPGKVTLIGYSLGGRLALHFAQAFPDRIERLILLSTNPGVTQEKEKRLTQDKKWAELLRTTGIESFLKKWYAQPLFASLHSQVLKNRTHHNPEALARILIELSPAALPSCWDAFSSFSFKTLFLFGELDVKYSQIATQIKKMRGSLTVDAIPNAGHAIHIENPEACQQKINQFLNERT